MREYLRYLEVLIITDLYLWPMQGLSFRKLPHHTVPHFRVLIFPLRLRSWVMLGDIPMHCDGVFSLLSKYVTCQQFIGRMHAEILYNSIYPNSYIIYIHIQFIHVAFIPCLFCCYGSNRTQQCNNGWFKYVKHTLKHDPSILARRRDTPQGLDMIWPFCGLSSSCKVLHLSKWVESRVTATEPFLGPTFSGK